MRGPAPGVVRSGDALDFFMRQLAVNAIHEVAHLAYIYEKRLPLPFSEFAVRFTSGHKPETDGGSVPYRKADPAGQSCNPRGQIR